MKTFFLSLFFLISSKIFAVDVCVMTTKSDPFLTDKQDCTNIVGGANQIGTRFTADHLLFLANNGFTLMGVTSNASATVYVFSRQ